jgi:protein involved in polysaccharide export with SLBB domain
MSRPNQVHPALVQATSGAKQQRGAIEDMQSLRISIAVLTRKTGAVLLSARFPAYLAFCCLLGLGTAVNAQNSSSSSSNQNCDDSLASNCSGGNAVNNDGNLNQSGGSNSLIQSSADGSTTALGLGQRSEQTGQVYIDQAGTGSSDQRGRNTSRINDHFPPDPMTDMQRLAKASTGELLPVFGRDLFQRAPSTFAPANQIPAMVDYVVGPGDVILLRLWGPEPFNGQLTVDSSGSIYVPHVGAIHVAGFRVDQLQSQIDSEVRHTFRNFNLSVNLGRLRSIQVYVVGEARRPGAYTVSALSTVLNVLFVSGGPSVQGSLRRIQVRRQGKTIGELDLYDLILKGDKTHDIRLEPDDTIFIPSVGPQAALAGSVHHPAIYELRGDTTIGALLDYAGGFTPTASSTQISLERIAEDKARAATTVNLDAAGRAMMLRDGDVLYANHITAAYQQSVTIRGNLANPGRFQWHAGMRLTDIIPDRMSLLTKDYWQQRNRLGVPVPLFEPLRSTRQLGAHSQRSSTTRGSDQLRGQRMQDEAGDATQMEETANDQGTPSGSSSADRREANNPEQETSAGASGTTISRGSLAEEQQSAGSENLASTGERNRIRIPAPEIDWSYAAIERLNPDTLQSTLVPFSLSKLLQDHDPSQNLELQPGDIVTIMSQADVHVSQDEQTKYVRLEGEFKSAGVYSVGANETLQDLVRRAGGLSSKAYLYGASFTRESARVVQQQRLDEYITSVSLNMQRAAAVRSVSVTNGSDPNALLTEQRDAIDQLRKLRATGRIVLEFRSDSTGEDSIPPIPLENGDVFRVPSRPSTVNVIGAVYGQNIFLYDPKRRVEDYLLLAGKPNRYADRKHAFIIRADGSVYSRERADGMWKNSFDATQIDPGDTIVIPEQPIRPSFVRDFIDYSQIFSQFALGAAAISVIKGD